MRVIKYKNGNRNISPFNDLFDGLFNTINHDFFNVAVPNNTKSAKVNVVESDDGFRLEVSAPGFNKTDFKVQVDGELLTISGKTETTSEENKEHYTRREFSTTSFERSFTLPENVDSTNIKANYENGILHLTIPKVVVEEEKPLEIEIG